MKKSINIILFLSLTFAFAQQNITLEEIWKGAFRTKNMQALNGMKNNNFYSLQTEKSIDIHDFKTQEKLKSIFETKNFPEIKNIDSYTFDVTENLLLIAQNSEPIYRHSSVSDFYLYNSNINQLTKIADYKIQEPTFSPDSKKIAYTYQNNIYVYDIQSNKHTQITNDGKKNSIINGTTDWVYEEEFAFVKAFEWSTDSKNIAFLKFDETDVPQFSMDVFGKDLYPNQEVFKYPKAGEKNALVSLHFYNIEIQKLQNVNLSQYKDFYIARIKWSNHKDLVSIQVLNRHQNQLDLLLVNANDATTKIIYQEKNNTYIDVNDHLTFLKDNQFIFNSEKDGYSHFYLFDANGKQINPITKGNFDVTKLYGIDTKNKKIYYQSTEVGSTNRSVYSIDFNGKNKKNLTPKMGTNDATFSPNYDLFINQFQNSKTPSVYEMIEVKSLKTIKEIVNNQPLLEKLKNYQLPEKEYFTIKINGNDLNAYMIKPKNMESGKKYPLLMFQYSGPGSQQVANQWMNSNDYWHTMLAQQGYVIACVDGRGTGYKGADFKKVTQKELGKYEVEDQIAAAQLFATYSYIDKNRIGIWGWSYGGFMSSNCILKGNDVFKTAVAVAPVTNWRFYDSIYTERFMTTPQENPSGYDNNSPINHVDKLKGNYLIIHGTADDNVHFQNATHMIRALQLANKQFDQAIYPDTNHGIYGGNIRLQLYTKMTNYIKEKL